LLRKEILLQPHAVGEIPRAPQPRHVITGILLANGKRARLQALMLDESFIVRREN
jgi:hypothetical protein